MGHIIINIIMETAIYSFRLYQVRKFGFVQKFGLNRARKIIKIRNRNPDPYGRQLSGSASRTNWFIHHWLALLYILWRHQKMTSYSLYQSSTNVYFRSEILTWRSSEQCSAKPREFHLQKSDGYRTRIVSFLLNVYFQKKSEFADSEKVNILKVS